MLNLSVIVATKDNDSELLATLRSLPENLVAEVVIINAGKNNYSQDQFPLLKINALNEPDFGISDAWNKGIKLAAQPYVFILNSGDLLASPEFLIEAVQLMNKNSETGFVHGNQIFEDPIAGKILQRPKKQSLGRGMPFLVLTTVFRKSVFERVGIFDLNYRIAMDYDWALRSVKNKIQSVYLDLPVLVMDGRGISNTQEWRGIKECFRSIRMHFPNAVCIHLFYFVRVVLFSARKTMLILGLKELLATFKRLKHK